ncbi:hypothetical protein TSAR_016856 [Trichomalopsis sarcophagae]|uniref:Uncharacterized protein n=1 Tax=Trichomalopsis sarcophagae TaxID=543379 RepID=A0A232EKH4_9HYME|nr:hypothetical protein TSAR_016856 [Trichomalopsis sarcophagae]
MQAHLEDRLDYTERKKKLGLLENPVAITGVLTGGVPSWSYLVSQVAPTGPSPVLPTGVMSSCTNRIYTLIKILKNSEKMELVNLIRESINICITFRGIKGLLYKLNTDITYRSHRLTAEILNSPNIIFPLVVDVNEVTEESNIMLNLRITLTTSTEPSSTLLSTTDTSICSEVSGTRGSFCKEAYAAKRESRVDSMTQCCHRVNKVTATWWEHGVAHRRIRLSVPDFLVGRTGDYCGPCYFVRPRFKLTSNGNFDLENRKLCYVSDAVDQDDAVNLKSVKKLIQQIDDKFEKDLQEVESLVNDKIINAETEFSRINKTLRDLKEKQILDSGINKPVNHNESRTSGGTS